MGTKGVVSFRKLSLQTIVSEFSSNEVPHNFSFVLN